MSREILVVATPQDECAAITSKRPIFGTVKLPTDDESHPFGQWSGVLERTGVEGPKGLLVLRLTFMSARAPIGELVNGTHIEFFRPPQRLASLKVLLVPTDGTIDRDPELVRDSPARLQQKLDSAA